MYSKSETVGGRRAKRSKIWDSGTLVAHIRGPMASSGQANFWGVIRCTCFKMESNSKTAGREAKRTNIWDAGVLVQLYVWGTFELVVLRPLAFRSFGELAMFSNRCFSCPLLFFFTNLIIEITCDSPHKSYFLDL